MQLRKPLAAIYQSAISRREYVLGGLTLSHSAQPQPVLNPQLEHV
jgi:hypothetical protein